MDIIKWLLTKAIPSPVLHLASLITMLKFWPVTIVPPLWIAYRKKSWKVLAFGLALSYVACFMLLIACFLAFLNRPGCP